MGNILPSEERSLDLFYGLLKGTNNELDSIYETLYRMKNRLFSEPEAEPSDGKKMDEKYVNGSISAIKNEMDEKSLKISKIRSIISKIEVHV